MVFNVPSKVTKHIWPSDVVHINCCCKEGKSLPTSLQTWWARRRKCQSITNQRAIIFWMCTKDFIKNFATCHSRISSIIHVLPL